jgi:intein/homing endonuclease
LEIKDIRLFFIGIIILIIGLFVVIFDYSQLQLLENDYSLTSEEKEILFKMQIEFLIGNILLISGISMTIISIFKKLKD